MDPVVSWVPFEVTLWIGYGFSFLSRKLSGRWTNTSCSFRGSYLNSEQAILVPFEEAIRTVDRYLLFLSRKLSGQWTVLLCSFRGSYQDSGRLHLVPFEEAIKNVDTI